MSAVQLLLYAASGVPLALAALALWPAARSRLIHTLPMAPLPALAAALLVPVGSIEPLPRTLLGAALMVDAPARLFLGVGALLWTLAGLYARATVTGPGRGRFAGFWLVTLAGNMLLFVAADLVTFYLAFAVLSLAAFGLVVHEGTAEARRAARIYLALAIFGEVLLLLGLMIGASGAGSIAIADVRAALAAVPHRDLALGLLVAAFGLKAGLVPLHVWLPLAHPAAPVPASAVLSGAIVKAGLFGLIRFLPLEADLPGWSAALVMLGLATAYYGALVGMLQRRAKTVLAYSTISQMGLVVVLLGAGFGSPGVGLVLSAAGLYAAHHSLAKGSLFLAVGVLHSSAGSVRSGMLAATAIVAFALAGLPLTGGALAKLAIKGPLGPGLATGLVTLSAVGTTLLMLRFLQLVRRDPAPDGARLRWAQALPFLVCAAAAFVLPALLFPQTSGLTLGYALEFANLWGAAWPILVGLGLMAGALRWGRAAPFIPEGDLVVPAERLLARLEPFVEAVRTPGWSPVRPGGLGRPVGEWLDRVERSLVRRSLAAAILLATGLTATAFLFHAAWTGSVWR